MLVFASPNRKFNFCKGYRLRIISGTARGKRLAEFSGERIRPTADRVREALFSILVSRFGSLNNLRVLDLFAGTGALALEALSRGAQSAVLVESHPESLRLMNNNITACRLEERATVVRGELPAALSKITGQRPFDLIFIDPPYGQGLIPPVLAQIDRLGLLADSGVIIVETDTHDLLPATLGALQQTDRRIYGSTAVSLYERIDPSA